MYIAHCIKPGDNIRVPLATGFHLGPSYRVVRRSLIFVDSSPPRVSVTVYVYLSSTFSPTFKNENKRVQVGGGTQNETAPASLAFSPNSSMAPTRSSSSPSPVKSISSITSASGPRKGRSETMPSAVRRRRRLGDVAATATRVARLGLGLANDDSEQEEDERSKDSWDEEDIRRALLVMAAGERKPIMLNRRPAAPAAAAAGVVEDNTGRTTAEAAVAVDKARQRPRKDIAPRSTAVGLDGCLRVMWVRVVAGEGRIGLGLAGQAWRSTGQLRSGGIRWVIIL